MKTFRLASALWLSTIVLSTIALTPSGPARAADPLGTWYTADKDSQVRITNCGGALCGSLGWLKGTIDPAPRPPEDRLQQCRRQQAQPAAAWHTDRARHEAERHARPVERQRL